MSSTWLRPSYVEIAKHTSKHNFHTSKHNGNFDSKNTDHLNQFQHHFDSKRYHSTFKQLKESTNPVKIKIISRFIKNLILTFDIDSRFCKLKAFDSKQLCLMLKYFRFGTHNNQFRLLTPNWVRLLTPNRYQSKVKSTPMFSHKWFRIQSLPWGDFDNTNPPVFEGV